MAESEQPVEKHWRRLELERRIKGRTTDGRSLALLQAGKQQIIDRKRAQQDREDEERRLREFDGGTQLRIVEMEHAQSLLIRRSDQTWDINKQLRSMQQSIQLAAESQKGRQHNLDDLRLSVLNLRELAGVDGRLSRPTADDEVDIDLFVNEEKEKHAVKCPKCHKAVLSQFLEVHVRACGNALFQLNQGGALAQEQLRAKLPSLTNDKGGNQESNKTKTIVKLHICPSCGKKILASRLKKHSEACVLRMKRQQDRDLRLMEEQAKSLARSSDAEKLGKMQSQPPLELRVLSTSCNSMTLSWKPPVFTGGLVITDYIISMSTCHTTKHGKKSIRSISKPVEFPTSQWCMSRPVAQRGFTLRGIAGGTEYVDIKVCAKNAVGRSEFSNVVESVHTTPVEAPSSPLMLECSEVTSNSFSLLWCAPMSDGGAPITHYEISYMTMVQRDIRRARGDSGAKHGKTVLVKTPGPQNSFTVAGLQCSTKYMKISIVAVNQSELVSEPSNRISEVQTLLPDEIEVVEQEIERISRMKGKFVDSSLNAGFSQRLSRMEYMNKLSKDLQNLKRKAKHKDDIKRVEQGEHGHESEKNERMKRESDRTLKRLTSNAKVLASGATAFLSVDGRQSTAKVELKETNSEGYASHDESEVSSPLYSKARGSLKVLHQEQEKTNRPTFLRAASSAATGTNPGLEGADATNGLRRGGRVKPRKTVMETTKVLRVEEHGIRRNQFYYRIQKIEEEMKGDEETRSACIMRRAALTKDLDVLQIRILELQAELDRANAFKGKYMDSKVVHGRMQRFETGSLRESLEAEVESALERMANGKREMIQIHKTLDYVAENAKHLGIMLAERKTALSRFEVQAEKKEKLVKDISNWRLAGVRSMFGRLRNNWKFRKRSRLVIGQFLNRLELRELAMALRTWKQRLVEMEESVERDSRVSGVGSLLIEQARTSRVDMETDAIQTLQTLAGVSHTLETGKRTFRQIEHLEQSVFFDREKEEQEDFRRQFQGFAHQQANFHRGMVHLRMGELNDALKCFLDQAKLCKEIGDTLEHAKAYVGSGKCYHSAGKHDKAIVHFDRAKSLASECGAKLLEAEALLGISRAYCGQTLFNAASDYGERALVRYEDMNDRVGEAEACRALIVAYEGVHDYDKVHMFQNRASIIENEIKDKVHLMWDKISSAEKKLVNVTAEQSDVVELELVSSSVPAIRKRIEQTRLEAVKVDTFATTLRKEIEVHRERYEKVVGAIVDAENCQSEEMDTDLVHGTTQRFRVPELLVVLKNERDHLDRTVENLTAEETKLTIRVKNLEDDMHELSLGLKVELGSLMRHVMKKRVVRCATLNVSNVRGNDVKGQGIGGVEQFACSAQDTLFLFDLNDGALFQVISGHHAVAPGPSRLDEGHRGTITSLCFHDTRLYSGGVDKEVRVWDSSQGYKCIQILRGSCGTIWDIVADHDKVVTGSADNDIRIWGHETGQLLNVLQAHFRTVRCLELAPGVIFSGSTDCDIIVWDVKDRESHTDVELRQRLSGHDCAVNVIRSKGSEVVSGGMDGRILVWNVLSGQVLRECVGHTGPIHTLQFDATKIVSGGADGDVRIFDIAVGECLNTLRGHKGAVLALQFDNQMMISLSTDNTFREWTWSNRQSERGSRKIRKKDKLHMLEPGETLQALEKRYGSKVEDLQKWNRVVSNEELYVGMRLVVVKGDDDPDAEAEQNRKGKRGAKSNAERIARMNKERAKRKKFREQAVGADKKEITEES